MSVERPSTQTALRRPQHKRPPNGLLAWQATIGHIAQRFSPDAMLKLQVYPVKGQIRWSVQASWGPQDEFVRDAPSLETALCDLWREVERHHQIFETFEDAFKAPANYAENEWVDSRTGDTLTRFIRVTQAAFRDDWLLVMIYQPVQTSETRVQVRLIAHDNTVHVGGRGATFFDACHDLYNNAAPHYATAVTKHDE